MQLIIFIGIQASGKSTFYQQYFYHTHLRINLGMLKTRHREKLIFEACLASKTKCVIDNTNVSAEDRARYIHQAKQAGFQIIAYYFQTSLEGALTRNLQRQGKALIPEKGVRATHQRLQAPQLSEGFDEIYQVQISSTEGKFSIQYQD
ncbi:ATP-binding protein [Acinetobacter brisouii]|uniref:ATP-binding protein n=1 Tax=Acinetobacter brisouii TaxID=396323 RepID=UPI00124FA8CE|nr:ATP-binding protein [Acinetobacter brisouii]